MNIAVVIALLKGGGAERVVAELSARWVRDGHRVSVITFDPAKAYPLDPEVEHIVIDGPAARGRLQGLAGIMRRVFSLRSTLRRCRPDVVVSFIHKTNVSAVAAMLGTDVPVVVSERTHPPAANLSRAWEIARRLAYRRASALVVVTPEARDWATRFIPRERVFEIPNAVRAPSPRAVVHARPVLLGVGRLHAVKGFDQLLRAFAAIHLRHPEWTLQLYGEGPERPRLEALAEELGISSRLNMPGFTHDVDGVMQAADLFVLPSRNEGFPSVLLEAMMNRCPIVAFDCESGPRNIIRHDQDGILVPAGDIPALAAALDRAMGDATLRKRLADNATQGVARFSQDRVNESWMGVLHGVISGRPAGAARRAEAS
jgi:glycosyltransferase involved in cell wall biosynthesis